MTDNLYFDSNAVMTVTGSLTGSTIGIMQDTTRVFTSGFGTHNQNDPQTIFKSDLSTMTITLQDNEAQINAGDPDIIYYNVRAWDEVNKCVVTTVKSLTEGQYTVMPNNSEAWFQLHDTYYIVKGYTSVNDLDILPNSSDTLHLILCNGATLDFEEFGSINIRNYKTLCIYDQPCVSANMGKIRMGTRDGYKGQANGIGYQHGAVPTPGTVEFHGGDIYIDASKTDGSCAIGPKNSSTGENDKFIFYGGKIVAKGGNGSAGIGSATAGRYCGNIIIYGGNIT